MCLWPALVISHTTAFYFLRWLQLNCCRLFVDIFSRPLHSVASQSWTRRMWQIPKLPNQVSRSWMQVRKAWMRMEAMREEKENRIAVQMKM